MGDVRVPAITFSHHVRRDGPPFYAPWIPRGVNVSGNLGDLGEFGGI